MAVDNQGNEYGPTKEGDSLWLIASKVRSETTISRHQVMIALLRANPQAFRIPCNFNTLKIGQTLRIPTLAEVQISSPQEAKILFERQNADWATHRKTRRPLTCNPEIEAVTQSSPMTDKVQTLATHSQISSTPSSHSELAENSAMVIKIGILAKRGTDNALEMWRPTADYLTEKMPTYRFIIVPLPFEAIYSAVARGEVDFVIANSGMYVEFEALYGANRIATLKNSRLDGVYTIFGGVVFRKVARIDIRQLEDFKGKTFMGVDETSLGGWRAAWREFKNAGIDPYKDFAKLTFGSTHDDVVYAVRDGLVDGGTVRTDTLERMANEGKIDLKDFIIINQQQTKDFPFALSTRLYPEWPFAVLKHTPTALAEQVAVALLQMPAKSEAARASASEGWTIPLNYEPIHECFKELYIPPYQNFGKVTLKALLEQQLHWVLGVTFGFLLLAITTIYFQRQTLTERHHVEMMLRESDAQSKHYAQQLEVAVAERTADLAVANAEITALNNQLRAENLRMSAELAITHRLQQMILPKEHELDQIKGLDIAGFMQPADEVGGDYYDVIEHNGRVKIAIGDVTGHGLESGVLAIMVRTAIRTLVDNDEIEPIKILTTINRTIYDNVQRICSDKSLTLALLDYEAGILHLSGQHESMIIIRNGEIKVIDTNDLGFPIGLEKDITPFVSVLREQLYPGDVVVLYTDGITEAENNRGEFYGLERLCETIQDYWLHSASTIRQAIVHDVRQFIGDHKVFDDITLLVLKQKPMPEMID